MGEAAAKEARPQRRKTRRGGRQDPRSEPDQAEEGGAVRPDRRHGAAVRHAAHQGGVPEHPDAPAARRADQAQAQRPALALEAVFEAGERFPGAYGGLRGGLHAHEKMASFRQRGGAGEDGKSACAGATLGAPSFISVHWRWRFVSNNRSIA